jgi:purine-binding chemotaxis protein CheW
MYDELLENGMDTMQNRYLTFELGEEMFGLEIRFVTEIVGIQPVNSIPETPDYIRGVINLRGKIIPVIDMRLKFGKQSIAYTDRTCIIVIETEQFSVGLIVDRVAEVLTLGDDQIVPPPGVWAKLGRSYLSGIGKVEGRVNLLLDCDKLFSETEAQEIGASADNAQASNDKN